VNKTNGNTTKNLSARAKVQQRDSRGHFIKKMDVNKALDTIRPPSDDSYDEAPVRASSGCSGGCGMFD
jgi:hypothetical protein